MMQNGFANGNVGLLPPPRATPPAAEPPPDLTRVRSDIMDMVRAREQYIQPLITRMEQDYARYRLVPHINRDNQNEPLPDLAVYTSNMPKVFADKVISWQILAELLGRVPHIEALNHPPEADNMKERFFIGCLKSADERLKRMKEPSLRGQQAFYTTVRGGWIGGRCLLVNRPDGTSYVDITAWDPMHITFGLGPDGLDWACYKVKKTPSQIKKEWGVEIRGSTGKDKSDDAERSGIWTYDFYDGQVNMAFTDAEFLKQPTPHGSPRTPIYLELVGPQPVLQSEATSNLIADVGESVYSGARDVYEKYNDILSITLEIVARARDQTIIFETADGKKTLPENPYEKGTEISTRAGERLYTLELQRMAAEFTVYLTAIAGELQRATLPFSAYGETPFQLSGYAITQLRQATETVLSNRIEALTQMYMQISNLLYDQFMTGSFNGLQLSGKDAHRQYFNEMITPEMVANTCDYTVKLTSQLPQDDASKWAMAEQAKKLELLSDADILDHIVGIQDAEQSIDKVRAQKAEQGLPEAVLYTLGTAATQRGDMVVANMYLMAYKLLMAQKTGQMPPDSQAGEAPAGNRRARGMEPEVLPAASQGQTPQPETSNNGPSMVAPGTPRPGAQGQ